MTSGIWHKTRRLVISDKPSQVEVQRCNSFWLPLADIQYACRGTQVMLQWSDCNQTKEQRLGDSNLTYSRVYKPETPNNKVEIVFRDVVAAQAFIDVVTRANSGSSILWRRLGTPLTQELRLYKVQQKPSHFIVHVSVPTVPGGDIVQSKLFIQQTDSILDIWTHSLVPGERTLSVRFCGRVSTPNYSSDVNDKPSDDTATVARCSKAMLVFSEYKLDFPLISDTDGIGLPTDLREILELVTGWTICFLASGVKVTAPNAFKKTTDYGLSDVTLWESSRDAHTDAPREAIFAFRQHGPKKDYLWRTATITAQSQATYKSPDAEITIFGKSSGDLLDTSTLRTTTASALPTHSATDALASRKRPAGKQKSAREPTTLKLRFARHAEYKSFSACFDELLQTAWVDAQLQTRRRVATYLSRDSQSTDSRAGSLQQGGRGRC
ncbi:uncharacterized protein M421DRAFT_6573 [Didymella exigua CBS 183.55]|uniref:Uncharacterized protein n=1 Tax=Didymella exigua CBS 183.55 TaxID=1150837 RepID=A0A6A5RFF7_9PLEO|nr:uncharacterized protein M421DRAFT_6573 [Didymella exigua CBS 183.55]KAF1927015.1 hypothetical protein M421DRAFT_6573 [Didymella exigua CBS 183.55]